MRVAADPPLWRVGPAEQTGQIPVEEGGAPAEEGEGALRHAALLQRHQGGIPACEKEIEVHVQLRAVKVSRAWINAIDACLGLQISEAEEKL